MVESLQPAELWTVYPRPASFEWFASSLSDSGYFDALPETQRNEVYDRFCMQVVEDSLLQERIIAENFVRRPGSPFEIREEGKSAVRDIQQTRLSPVLMGEVCPLEDLVSHNWQSGNLEGKPTIPLLFEKFVHVESVHFSYSPPESDGEEGHSYARFDLTRHARFKEYISFLRDFVAGDVSGLDVPAESIQLLIARTGSALFPDVLNVLNNTARKKLNPQGRDRFILHILSDETYFEASRAVRELRPIQAVDMPGLHSFPSGPEKMGKPTVVVTSTESNAPHIWSVDRSLQEGGLCVFYAEPIGNNPSMDVPDIKKVIDTIRHATSMSADQRKVFVVLDTTTMGGRFDLSEIFESGDFGKMNVLVIESGNKYLSYGINKANLGIAYGVGPDMEWFFEELKGSTQMKGLPDMRSVLAMPLLDEQVVVKRKLRLRENAQFLTQSLSQTIGDELKIVHPSLPTHPQQEQSVQDYEFEGSIFFVELPDEDAYNEFEQRARQSKVLEYGTSFGFNRTRLEVIRRTAEDGGEEKPLAVRVSVGTENIRQLMGVFDELKRLFALAI